jgi:hypothetical protein
MAVIDQLAGLVQWALGSFSRTARLELKVTAAGLGALLGGLLVALLERFVWRAGLPGTWREIIDAGAALLGALILGWLAPHTERPDLAPTGPTVVAEPRPPAQ